MIGFHDWEIVDYVRSLEQLKENIRAKSEGRNALRVETGGIECPIVDRVCLRCDKTDMDLSSNALKISAKIIKDRLVKKVRQAKAKQILGKRY